MKAKKDIVHQSIQKQGFVCGMTLSDQVDIVYPSMDEYAKQVAIGFACYVIGQLPIESNTKLTERDLYFINFPATADKQFNKFLQQIEPVKP